MLFNPKNAFEKKPIYSRNKKRNSYVKTAMYKIVPLHFSKVTSPFPNFPAEILESILLANNANRIIWVYPKKAFEKKPIYSMNNKLNSHVKTSIHKIAALPFSKVTSPFPNFPAEILESTLRANNANRIIWV